MRLLPVLWLMACGPMFSEGADPRGSGQDAGALAVPCVEGAFLAGSLATEPGACGEAVHAFAGPVGAQIALTVEGLGGLGAWVTVQTVGGDLLAARPVPDGGALEVELPWSGEFIARVQPDAPAPFTLRRSCLTGCATPWTRYPLVLMHGMAGTDSWFDRLDYFHGVADALGDEGFEVVAPAVDPFQISEVRSLTWAEHLEGLAAEGRHRRFNLIGHSQGGLDARYVAAHLDPHGRVVSVLTVGTPHRGVPAVDVIAGTLGGYAISQSLVDGAFDALGRLYGLDSDQDILAQVEGFGIAAMADWNAATPDRPDVHYASWSGETCQAWELSCLWRTGGEVVTPLLSATHLLVKHFDGPNDGLVSVTSAAWGVHYGTLGADHLDQVGQVGGLTSLAFDHVGFYREEADYLWYLGF